MAEAHEATAAIDNTYRRNRTRLTVLKIAYDAAAWVTAITVVKLVHFDFAISNMNWAAIGLMGAVAGGFQAGMGSFTGLYRRSRLVGSFDEVAILVSTVALTTSFSTVANLLLGQPRVVHLSGTTIGGFVALALMGGARYGWRVRFDRSLRPQHARERLLVFGAGEAGTDIIRALLHTPGSPYLPVALLDDDPTKGRLSVMGVPVRGNRQRLAAVARATEATTLLIAMPSAGATLIQDLTARASEAGLKVRILPSLAELLVDGAVGVNDIRELRDEDLLGRRAIDTDMESIAGYVTGKRILVTGAGGSIGSELCRQIYRFAPSRLVMLDRDESALHEVQLSIAGHGLLDSPDLVLADIRSKSALDAVFAAYQPEVVFHAAALKHLPLLERHPGEAILTNVRGTLYLLEAAEACGVERFVNISTDKAADPTSVLGYSKRLAERLTATVAERAEGIYLSVRFGNVLGSRGSVLTAFRAQIASGGPLTVTHADVTRYFMTVAEACQLVIQAAAIGTNGYAHVLDMGAPVRIADVAKRMAESAQQTIEIVYTGLRPGEKLHEVLWGRDEEDVRPVHPLISHVAVPPIDPGIVQRLSPIGVPESVTEQLCKACVAHAVKELAG